jgi:WD40 repeat protein
MIVLYRLFLASLVTEALFALFHEKSFSVQDGATNVNAIALYKNSILHTSSNDVLEKDIETGFLLRTFRAHINLITAFVVSEDFRMITSGFDNMIVVWDLETGSVIRRIPLGAVDTRISHISLVNDQLFTGGLDWIVRQVNLRSGQVRSIGKF